MLQGRLPKMLNDRIDIFRMVVAVPVFGVVIWGLVWLRDSGSGGPILFMYVLCIVWLADIGAYFAGRRWGRHKLAPVISPGKTWEGVVGGVLGALTFCFVARATFFSALTLTDALIVGVATSVLAPVGDLVESLLKRSAGVKDSGRLIPGHGGILDRIDALLFVGAFVFLYTVHLR